MEGSGKGLFYLLYPKLPEPGNTRRLIIETLLRKADICSIPDIFHS